MWFKVHRIFLLGLFSLSLWLSVAPSYASDADLMDQAKQAYQRKNAAVTARIAQQLKSDGSVLAPYAEHWAMVLNIDSTPDDVVEQFINQNKDSYIANRVKEAWLKKLGKQEQWLKFNEQIVQFKPTQLETKCYRIQSRMMQDQKDSYDEAKALWMNTTALPPDCDAVFDELQQVDILNNEVVLQRFREALFDNRISLAKAILLRTDQVDKGFNKQVDIAYRNPVQALKSRTITYQGRYGKALYMFMLDYIAKTDPNQAYDEYKKINWMFSEGEKGIFYAQLGLRASMKHMPEALDWFAKANKEQMTNDQHEWYVRSALRAGNWKIVHQVIQNMPPQIASHPAWQYWDGRALKALNRPSDANLILAKIASERHYYGWLAQEELGASFSEPLMTYTPSDADIKSFTKQAVVSRVDNLLEADLRSEARLEWQNALDSYDDKTLLIAAQFALRKQWYDLGVTAAERTTMMHDYGLRYPTPYRDIMKTAAKQREIDEAWVYGIVRQESRFMHYAKSKVGAGGLMQVMPATAKWIAKKIGLVGFTPSMLHDINTNVDLGTYYMRQTLDQFNGQEVMATAAYNAGPGRAKRWAAAQPLEGAIYTETIPFGETRDYVKRVIANAYIYAPRLGLGFATLKSRLGTVPGTSETYTDKTADDFIETSNERRE